MPTSHVVDGFLVLVAGALLLCPGFVTSAMGVILLLPPVRSFANGVAGDAIRTRVSRRIRTVGSRLADDPVQGAPRTHGGPGPTTNHSRPNATFSNGGPPRGSTNGSHSTGPRNGGTPFGDPGPGSADANQQRAYRRPDEAETEPSAAGVWNANTRRGPVDDLDVIDLDGEEIVFGQGELGPSGF